MNLQTPVSLADLAAELKVGDLLLMRSRGELSSLIAWFGDSPYSHAAMVARDGLLVEAASAGVRELPLSQRLGDAAHVLMVDAYRANASDGGPLREPDRAAVMEHARSLLGTAFAMDDLVTIGILVALRDKPVSYPPLLRWVIHRAIDRAMGSDPGKMVCSEFIYRCFDECDVSPRGSLARRIVFSRPSGAAFPHVDVPALIKEVMPLLKPSHANLHANLLAAKEDASLLESVPEVDEHTLEQSRQALRLRLGISSPKQGLLKGTGEPGSVIAHPNPRLVRPRDLQESPSNLRLGRLMQAPDWRD
jgi:hypothetical protein